MGNKHRPELPEMVFLLSHGNQKRKDFNNAVQKKIPVNFKDKRKLCLSDGSKLIMKTPI